MSGLPHSLYVLLAIVLWLFVTALLIHQGRVNRWMRFCVLFGITYACGELFLFHNNIAGLDFLPLRKMLPELLFLLGSAACLGLALVRQFTPRQTIGLLLCYLAFASVAYMSMTGLYLQIDYRALGPLVAMALVVGLVTGVPAVIGYALVKAYTLRQMAGAVLLFLAVMAALFIVAGPTGDRSRHAEVLEQMHRSFPSLIH